MLLLLLLGCCFSRGLRGSRLVVECDIVEHEAGLSGSLDDITAPRAMKGEENDFVRLNIGLQVVV